MTSCGRAGLPSCATGWHTGVTGKVKQLTDLTCAVGQTVAFDGVDWVCADFPATGVTGLQRIQVNSAPADDFISTKQVVATCPAGKQVVGGGHILSFFGGATDVPLRSSAPTLNLQAWIVSRTNVNNTVWGLTAIAICADAD